MGIHNVVSGNRGDKLHNATGLWYKGHTLLERKTQDTFERKHVIIQ